MNAPQLWQELGNTYLKLGAADLAIGAFSKGLTPYTTDKEKALGWRVVADLCLELNEPNLAAEAFLQAANLFVTQPTDEAPRVEVDDAVTEGLPPLVSVSADQTAPEADELIVEAASVPAAADVESPVIEQQAEQSEALSFEQLPLGLAGYETAESVNAPAEPEVAEAAVEAHPDQIEINLGAIETPSELPVEASADIEPGIGIVAEVAPVESEITAIPAAETAVEGVAASDSNEPVSAAVDETAPMEVQVLAETESQLVIGTDIPAVLEEVASALEPAAIEQPVAEAVSVEPEEYQPSIAEAVADEITIVAESTPVAEESQNETEELPLPVAAETQPQEVVAEAQAVETTTLEETVSSPVLENNDPSDEPGESEDDVEQEVGDPVATQPIRIAIDDIVPNPYVVLHTAGMDELVETIHKEGMVYPLIVTPNVWNNKHLLLVGEWRLEAARRAGLQMVPALVRDVKPKEFLELTLLQNAQQPYLNPLDVARMYQFLVKDFDFTAEMIAERVGRSPLAVENILRLQNLTERGKQALMDHTITEDHAQALLCLTTPELQDEVLQVIVENELSIQRTEEYVSEINASGLATTPAAEQKSAIEIIIENDDAPHSDVAWLENNQPVVAVPADEISAEATPVDEAFAEPLTIIVDGASPVTGDSSEAPLFDPEAVTTENDLGYPVALPGTLADVRKNVLMAWKLESDPLSVACIAPARTDLALEGSAVAVMNQVENVTGRTILLPDTNAILQNLNDQALAEAVVEVVIPQVIEETPAVVQETSPADEVDAPEMVEEQTPPPTSAPETTPSEPESEAPARSREEDAVVVYKRVTELNPTNDRAWHMLGNLLLDLGRLDEAVSALEVAISLNASRDIYYYHLGIAQAVQKNYGDAVQSFEKALTLNPQNIFAHCSIIGYYRKLGREAEAEQHFQIVAPNIKLEKAYNRACFESICGNVDAALDLLQQAIENDHVPVKWIERDPDLDLVRDDPRYKALIAYTSASV